MSQFEYHPYRRLLGVISISIGGFVVGCVYKQPEVSVPSLGVAGCGIIKLVTDFADSIDMRYDVMNEVYEAINNPDGTE